MRTTRHARNRLRWIARSHPSMTMSALIEALPSARSLGYDGRGNRRLAASVGEVEVVVIVDEGAGVLVTLWVR